MTSAPSFSGLVNSQNVPLGIMFGAPAPFLKWPGGKRLLIAELLAHVPAAFGCYYEPFLGGAALFYGLRPTRAVLSDRNADLINCYQQVRDDPEGLLRRMLRMHNSETDYYAWRSVRPRKDVTRAARLLYLVNLSFNGIYRVNFDGAFNVPYGHRSHMKPINPDKLRAASLALQGVALIADDFKEVLGSAQKDDLIYLDPPYTVAHGSNGFVRYNARLFSWKDQERLATAAATLAQKGCYVLVSNAAHQSLKGLYPGFRTHEIERPSSVAASVGSRKMITELLFTSPNCP